MGSSSSKTESQSNSTQDVLRDPNAVASQMYKAFSQYQPQFEQQTLDLYKRYLPEYAATQDALTRQYAPNQYAIGETLAGQAMDQATNGLSDAEKELYLNQYKSLVGNQVNAPIGANFVAGNLVSQNLAAKQAGQNLGLALKLNPTTAGTVGYSPASFNVGNIYSSSLYGTNKSESSTTTLTETPSVLSQIGQVAGVAAGLMTGVGALGMGAGAASGGLGMLGSAGGGMSMVGALGKSGNLAAKYGF